MNAVEIEAAVSALALEPFNAEEFPFAFSRAFGNKETTIKRTCSRPKAANNALLSESGFLPYGMLSSAIWQST
jgi:hypothetical protein